MGRSTDEFIDDFREYGFDAEEAEQLAYRYIAEGSFMEIDEFITRVEDGTLGIENPELYDAAYAKIQAAAELNDFKKEHEFPLIQEDEERLVELEDRYTEIKETYNELKTAEEERKDEELEALMEQLELKDELVALQDVKRSYKVGAEFNGISEIVEYEDRNMYIPSSGYCFIKCIEKLLNRSIEKVGISPYEITLTAIRKHLKSKLKDMSFEEYLPQIYKPIVESDEIMFSLISKGYKSEIKDYIIILFPITVEKILVYHAVLARKHVTYDEILNNIKIKRKKTLSADSFTLPAIKVESPRRYVWVYDIETSSLKTDRGRVQIPEGSAFCRLDLSNGEISYLQSTIGEHCLEEMLDIMVNTTPYTDEYQVFAHNGGKFDHLFIKSCKNITLKDEFGSNGMRLLTGIIKRDANSPDALFKFKDSLSYLMCSLKVACKSFKIAEEDSKMDFDIVNKDHEWFIKHLQEWRPYMERDVTSLAKVLYKLEIFMESIAQSITTTCSISSAAWKLLIHNSHPDFIKNTRLAKDPTTQAFIREACYGGRIQHYRRLYDAKQSSDGLICIDATSLYPSAMYLSAFPIGSFKVMDMKRINATNLNGLIDKGYMFIAEVTMDANNIRHGIMPYRTENRAIIYPSGEFTGVYTSVEIEEALHEGYTIKEVKRGIYWLRKRHLFKDIVKSLYDKRKEYKEQNNELEYMVKILLNSLYGKMLENINVSTVFTNEETWDKDQGRVISHIKLKNGQTQFKYAKRKYSLKPTHIAAFILSYSRKIMNNIIRQVGDENVYYGDTDSIYVPNKIAEDKLEYIDYLGGFKNDYGNGKIITKAIFLDLKRYYLKFNDGSFKAKFLGLNFKSSIIKSNDASDVCPQKEDQILALYEELLNTNTHRLNKVYQEKWFRSVDEVRIDSKDMSFELSMNKRAIWKANENECYSINCDMLKPTRRWNTELTKFMPCTDKPYILTEYGLYSSHPLKAKTTQCLNSNLIKTTFVVYDHIIHKEYAGKHYIYKSFGPIGNPLETKKEDMKPLLTINMKFHDELAHTITDDEAKIILEIVQKQIDIHKQKK